jgi:hypothetical protein
MGSFRFYRRAHIFPGLSVNLSRSGPSLTVGMRGAHVTVGSRGVTRTVGIPGTGIFYTSRQGRHTGFHSAHQEEVLSPEEQAAADRAAQRIVWIVGIGVVLALLMLAGALSH